MFDSILDALNNNHSVYFEHYFWSKKFKHLLGCDGYLPRGFSVSKSYDEEDDPHIYISYVISYNETDEYIDYINKLFNFPIIDMYDCEDGYYLDFYFDNIHDFEVWLKSIDLVDYNIEFYDY